MRGPLPAVVVIVVSSITANAQVTPQPPDYARALIELAENARLQAVGSGALAAARFDDAVRERFGEPDGAGPTAYVNSVLKLMVDDARDEESPELRFLTARDRLRTSLHQQLLDGRPLNASDPFTGTAAHWAVRSSSLARMPSTSAAVIGADAWPRAAQANS